MTIVGFNFTKLEAEKKELVKGKININNNVSIKNVEEKKLSLANDKQKVLSFTFEFTAKYDPDIGSIKFVGDVLFMEDAKKNQRNYGWMEERQEITKRYHATYFKHSIKQMQHTGFDFKRAGKFASSNTNA